MLCVLECVTVLKDCHIHIVQYYMNVKWMFVCVRCEIDMPACIEYTGVKRLPKVSYKYKQIYCILYGAYNRFEQHEHV